MLKNARLCRRLNAAHMALLQERTKILIAEKHWETAGGIGITDEMQVTIAGQAALMLLGVRNFYFDNVSTLIVYPESFERDFQAGVITERRHHAGEAWQGGPVILSWQDVITGGANEKDGHNLILHEFAHTLDGIDGEMGGNVIFDDRESMQRWEEVSSREFKALCHAAEHSKRTLLDHYGATNRAEFFAVASETFFELPEKMNKRHPELFKMLVKYYRLDPTTWQVVGGPQR